MFRRRKKGQGLVEFALILPVLLMVILGIIEASWLIWSYITVQNAAREAARYAVTGQPTTDGEPFSAPVDVRVEAVTQIARDAAAGLPISFQADYIKLDTDAGGIGWDSETGIGSGECAGYLDYYDCFKNADSLRPQALGILVSGQFAAEAEDGTNTLIQESRNHAGEKGLYVTVEVFYNANMLDPIYDALMAGNSIQMVGRVSMQNEGINLATKNLLPPTPAAEAPPLPGGGGGSGSGGASPSIFARYNGEEVNISNQVPAGNIVSFDLESHEPGSYYICFDGSPVTNNAVGIGSGGSYQQAYEIPNTFPPGIYKVKSVTEGSYNANGAGCNASHAAINDVYVAPPDQPIIGIVENSPFWPDNSLVTVRISGHEPEIPNQDFQVYFDGQPMLLDDGTPCLITTDDSGFGTGDAECVIPNEYAIGTDYEITTTLAVNQVDVSEATLEVPGAGDRDDGAWTDARTIQVTLFDHAPLQYYHLYLGNNTDGYIEVAASQSDPNGVRANSDGRLQVSVDIPEGYNGTYYLVTQDRDEIYAPPTSDQREIARTEIEVFIPNTPYIIVADLLAGNKIAAGIVTEVILRTHAAETEYDVHFGDYEMIDGTQDADYDPYSTNELGNSAFNISYQIPISAEGTTVITSFLAGSTTLYSATKEIEVTGRPYIEITDGNLHSPGTRIEINLKNHAPFNTYDVYIDLDGDLQSNTPIAVSVVTDGNGEYSFFYNIPIDISPTGYNPLEPTDFAHPIVSRQNNNDVSVPEYLYVLVTDLEVTDVGLPEDPQPGVPLAITMTVRNNSNITLTGIPIDNDVYINRTPNLSTYLPPGDDKVWFSEILPNETVVVSGLNVSLFNLGQYEVTGRTNTSDQVVEFIKANNVLSETMTLACTLSPELTLDTFDGNGVLRSDGSSSNDWVITSYGDGAYEAIASADDINATEAVAMHTPTQELMRDWADEQMEAFIAGHSAPVAVGTPEPATPADTAGVEFVSNDNGLWQTSLMAAPIVPFLLPPLAAAVDTVAEPEPAAAVVEVAPVIEDATVNRAADAAAIPLGQVGPDDIILDNAGQGEQNVGAGTVEFPHPEWDPWFDSSRLPYPTSSDSYHFFWNANGNTLSGGEARYIPDIVNAGRYNVYMWYPDRGSDAAPAMSVFVNNANGLEEIRVDQRVDQGQWTLLGTWGFNTGTGGYIGIGSRGRSGDQLGFTSGNAHPAVDALRFEYVSAGTSCFYSLGSSDTEVVIEAENAMSRELGSNGQSWRVAEDGNASGGYAMVVSDDGEGVQDFGASARMNYEFYVEDPGDYYVFLRAYGPSGGDDSAWPGIDGVSLSNGNRLDLPGGSYGWTDDWDNENDPPTFNAPTAGFYTLNIDQREDGSYIDQIVITKVNAQPTGGAKIASPCLSALPGDSPTDMAIAKSGPSEVLGGGPLEYTISVQNIGGLGATNVTITDTLPAELSNPVANPSRGSCSGTAPMVCNLVTGADVITSLEVVEITVSGTVNPTAAVQNVTNSVTVGADSDADSGNNTASVSTLVYGSGSSCFFAQVGTDDIVIEAESFNSRTEADGDNWDLVSNAEAGNGYVMQVLDDDGSSWNFGSGPTLEFEMFFATPGTYYTHFRGDAPDGSGDEFYVALDGSSIMGSNYIDYDANDPFGWELQSPANAPSFTVDVPGLHTLTLYARNDGVMLDRLLISTDNTQPGGAGQPLTPCVTTVPDLPPADLEITKSAAAEVEAGQPLVYTIDVANVGWQTATNVIVTDTLPSSLLNPSVTAATGGGSCSDPASPPLVCNFATVNARTTEFITVTTTAPSITVTQSIANTAEASADVDDNTSNNSDSVTTFLYGTNNSCAFAYDEGAGQIVIEAESFSSRTEADSHRWSLSSGVQPTSNDYAMTVDNNGGNNTWNSFGAGPQINYQLFIEPAGTYYVYFLADAYSDSGNDDEFYVGIDGSSISDGSEMNIDQSGGFDWTDHLHGESFPPRFTVDVAGVYNLNITPYDDGIVIDKIIVSSSDTPPSGTGQVESECLSSDEVPPPPTSNAYVDSWLQTDGSPLSYVFWDASAGATGYRVERATDVAFTSNFTATDIGAVTSLTDTVNLTCGTTYYYRVRALRTNSEGQPVDSVPSHYDKITPPCPELGPPLDLDATAVTSTTMDVAWTAATVADMTYNLIDEDFSSGEFGGFDLSAITYPEYVTGGWDDSAPQGGALWMRVGNVDNVTLNDSMRAKWSTRFYLPEARTITLRFNYLIRTADTNENDEDGEVYFSLNGEDPSLIERVDTSNDDQFDYSDPGDGSFNSYQTSQISLPAGVHTIDLIGVLTTKTYFDDFVDIWFDNLELQTTIPGVAPDTYILERAITDTLVLDWSPIVTITPAVTTTHLDTDLLCSTFYNYRVRSYLGVANTFSPYSNIDLEQTDYCSPFPPPINVVATEVLSDQIRIDWTDITADETEFYIERSQNGINWETIPGAVVSGTTAISVTRAYTLTNADACGNEWFFRVVGYRASDTATAPSEDDPYASGNTGVCPEPTPTPLPSPTPTPLPTSTPEPTTSVCTNTTETNRTLELCARGSSAVANNDAAGGYVFMNRGVDSYAFEMAVRLENIPRFDVESRAGLEIRDGLGSDARKVNLVIRNQNTQEVGIFVRSNAGGAVTQVGSWENAGGDLPMWLRIVRANGQFFFYYNAQDEAPALGAWTLLGQVADDMAQQVNVGMMTVSGSSAQSHKSVWSNFSVGCVSNSTSVCGLVDEEGGEVIIDAINFTDNFASTDGNNRTWTKVSNSAYSPKSAMDTDGTDYNNNTNGPMLEYSVNIRTPGQYFVWVLGRNAGGDSVHVGLSGVPVSTADNINSGSSSVGDGTLNDMGSNVRWFNGTNDGPRAQMSIPSQGIYVINVWAREDDFEFVQLLLTTDPDYVPGGLPDQSDCTVPTPPELPPGLRQCESPLDNTSFELPGVWDFGEDQNTRRSGFPYPDPGTSWGVLMPASFFGGQNNAPYLSQEFTLPEWLSADDTTAYLSLYKAVYKLLNPDFAGVDSPDDYLYAQLRVDMGNGMEAVTDNIVIATGADKPIPPRTNIDPNNPHLPSNGEDDWVYIAPNDLNLFDYLTTSDIESLAGKQAELYLVAPNPAVEPGNTAQEYTTNFYLDNVELQICTEEPIPDLQPGFGHITGQLTVFINGSLRRIPGVQVWTYRIDGALQTTYTVDKPAGDNYGFYNLEPGKYVVFAQYVDSNGVTYVANKSLDVVAGIDASVDLRLQFQ